MFPANFAPLHTGLHIPKPIGIPPPSSPCAERGTKPRDVEEGNGTLAEANDGTKALLRARPEDFFESLRDDKTPVWKLRRILHFFLRILYPSQYAVWRLENGYGATCLEGLNAPRNSPSLLD